ncbi:hypothetical protein ASF52_16575 [Methylobacterium sp. Leaf112]|nr:hypothetical protein ASF52_16575 [Methylobacterium sp. Leaf112]
MTPFTAFASWVTTLLPVTEPFTRPLLVPEATPLLVPVCCSSTRPLVPAWITAALLAEPSCLPCTALPRLLPVPVWSLVRVLLPAPVCRKALSVVPTVLPPPEPAVTDLTSVPVSFWLIVMALPPVPVWLV